MTSASRDSHKRPVCAITGAVLKPGRAVRAGEIRHGLFELLREDHPNLSEESLIDREVLASYRARYVERLLTAERRELGSLEREVVDSIGSRDLISRNIDEGMEARRTFGERVADIVAAFGGSWSFIILFFAALTFWMALNVANGVGAFDPYPFILLNLVLSCIAAVQAPIIMMSQRRQEVKDRHRSENDYRVNLKAELEIRHLHEKIDHLLTHQWERLAEIQAMQIELLQDLRDKHGKAP
jgi:uncharacterized membrane protein